MNRTQNRNDSINSILQDSQIVRKDYFVVSCFMIPICYVVSQFNDGEKGKYH